MNLQTRIQKLENRMISPETNFCNCWIIYSQNMLDLAYESVSYDVETVVLPEGDFCEKCKKAVSEKDLKMQMDLLAIYGEDL